MLSVSGLSETLKSFICGPNKKLRERARVLGEIFMSIHHTYTGTNSIEKREQGFHFVLRGAIAQNPEFRAQGLREEDIYNFLGKDMTQNMQLTEDEEFDIHLGYYLLFFMQSRALFKNPVDLGKVELEDLLEMAEENRTDSEKKIITRIFNLTREDFNNTLTRLKQIVNPKS